MQRPAIRKLSPGELYGNVKEHCGVHGKRQDPPGRAEQVERLAVEIKTLKRMGLNLSNLTAVEADVALG